MKNVVIIGIAIFACVGILGSYVILSSEISVEDKTLVVGTYSWNGLSFESTNGFTAIFSDHSFYTISFDINSNDTYDSDSIILTGNDNNLSVKEIRGLIHVLNNTIPNYTCYAEYGFIVYKSNHFTLSNDQYVQLTDIINANDFYSLNETYPATSNMTTDSSWTWITANNNGILHKVSCYNYWPDCYREIWELIMTYNEGMGAVQ